MLQKQDTRDADNMPLQRRLGMSDAALACEDNQGHLVMWSRGATRLLGNPASAVLGQCFSTVLPDAGTAIEGARARVQSGGFELLDGIPFTLADDRRLAIDLLATPFPLSENGVGILWTMMNSQPQGAHRPDETAMQQNLIEAIPIPVFVKDDEGRYSAFNQAWEDFFGRRRHEWTGRSVAEKFAPDIAMRYQAQDDRLMRTGDALEWEDTLRSARGDATPVIYRKTALRDAAGRVTGIVGTILDVTRLRLAESRFRQVVEMTPGALIVCDPRGRIRLVNAQTEALFGYARDQLMNMAIEQLLPDRLRTGHAAYRDDYQRAPVSRPMGRSRDLFARRQDGTEIPVEVALGPLPSDGEEWVIAVVADISARVATQRQIETSLREKTTLLNEIHHRVKNNLQVISSLLNLQASASRDERVRTALRDAIGRVRSIGLMHELLYERKNFATLDLGAYLQRLIRLVRSTYSADSVRVSFTIDIEAIPVSIGQAMHCGLIVNELLINALKHAFPAPAEGRIGVALRQVAAGRLLLTVSDDGIGFPQAPDVDVSETLGLQLIRLLADQMRGSLRVSHRESAHESVRYELTFPADGREYEHD